MSSSQRHEVSRAVCCDAKSFQRIVLIPQLFVFILLMLVGAFVAQDLKSNISRLAIVAYLLVVNLVVQTLLRQITVRLLSFHLTCLCLLLACLAFFLKLQPVLGLYLPVACLILCFITVHLRPRATLQVAIGPIAVVALYTIGLVVVQQQSFLHYTFEVVLCLLSCAIALIHSTYSAQTIADLPVENSAEQLKQAEYIQQSAGPNFERKTQTIISEEGQKILCAELASEFSIRLGTAVLFFNLILLAFLLAANQLNFVSASVVTLSLTLSLLLTAQLKSVSKQPDLYIKVFFTIALNLAVLLFGVFIYSASTAYSLVLSLMFALLFCTLPLPVELIVTLCFFTASFNAIFLRQEVVSWLLVLSTFVCLLLVIRQALFTKQLIVLRAMHLYLRHCFNLGVSVEQSVRILAEILPTISNVRQLLLHIANQAEIIGPSDSPNIQSGAVYTRALIEKANALQLDEGLLNLNDLGPQFAAVLKEWFNFLPQQLVFLRFSIVLNDREQEALIFLPVSPLLRYVGTARTLNSILSLSAVVRATIAMARNRYQSSDALLLAQNTLSQRELEFSDMVHMVNNTSQDISIQCDDLQRQLATNKPVQLQVIDTLSRYLSATVSDLKLAREILRLNKAQRYETIMVSVILEELQNFGNYRKHRKGQIFSFENQTSIDCAIKVLSREYLETAMRLLLRGLSNSLVNSLPQHQEICLRVFCADGLVFFEIQTQGIQLSQQEVAALSCIEEDSQLDTSNSSLQSYRVVGHFLKVSNCNLKLMQPRVGFACALMFSFQMVEVQPQQTNKLGRWALLVDDNPQVTSFYARIADALNLPYETATSLDGALSVVARLGRPKIVITDIQLDNQGSGLSLVSDLRKEYGVDLPIIVVSGQSSDAMGNQVDKVGATKFLTKPVSRGKLFAEIQNLLGI